MPSVAITDYTFPTLDLEERILSRAGADVVSSQCKTAEALISLVSNADAVITQFAPLTSDVIESMNSAKVIVRYGIGVDNVDLNTARAKGIPVCNVPDYCIDEVADHTLAFILSTTRQVVQNTLHVRGGSWGLATPLDNLRTLRDQAIAVVGFGRIGKEVAARLSAFKCRVMIFDPFVSAREIEESGFEAVSLEQAMQQADILTLHCPSVDQTRKMINADSISKMRRGAILINLARGDLVETSALEAALASEHLSAAAIDVCDPEPIPAESPLRTLPNVIAASHIASASPKSIRVLRESAANIAVAALRGEKLPNIVNP